MKKYTIEGYKYSKFKRFEIINYLIEQNNYINYLEIGIGDGECMSQIKIPYKNGVDPNSNYFGVDYKITSDEFFDLIKGHDIKYDIIFIDGLHITEQVDKDIQNSLNHLMYNGTIVLHDCNPAEYELQMPHPFGPYGGTWNGDVWKSIVKLRHNNSNVKINVVDTDWGCGILQFGNQELYNKYPLEKCLDYYFFDKNREELLNIISVEEFYKLYKKQ